VTVTIPIKRPALRWHGGKWKLAPWIVSHFPAHRIYVEPFGGGASVLLRKPRSYGEVYNDLDRDVVGLFRILRDPETADQLRRALELTPFAREEFDDAYSEAATDLDRARKLVIRSFMGFGSNGHNVKARTGFRANSNRSGTTPARDWQNYPSGIPALVDRLRGIVIECRDAGEVMAAHDGPATLHYVDPPYVPETRSLANPYDLKYRGGMYAVEMDADDHVRLLASVQKLTGAVILSGYRCALYDEILKDWRRVDRAAHADGARDRTESLWLSPGLDPSQGEMLVAAQ
jgi:DNA adenine methylase